MILKIEYTRSEKLSENMIFLFSYDYGYLGFVNALTVTEEPR